MKIKKNNYIKSKENYIILEIIGEGAFGKVYKGQRKCIIQIVEIKKIVKKDKKKKNLKIFVKK